MEMVAEMENGFISFVHISTREFEQQETVNQLVNLINVKADLARLSLIELCKEKKQWQSKT